MLFNSTVFILGFLPVALAGFFVIAALSRRSAAIFWLVATSLFFYSWWDFRNLFVIVPSVALNYLLGKCIGEARAANATGLARALTALGIGLGLCAIGYFKYLNFVTGTINNALGLNFAAFSIVLPLGISFFTFQQIKFLVDRYTGAAPEQPSFANYSLLVTFFPHVIAGPIVQHDDLLPQLKVWDQCFSSGLFADGVAIFLLGLAKKLVLADQFSIYANEGFNAVAAGHSLSFFAAWGAALSYTLQLYFDFSSYSDMAIGLARMFGLSFPLNFNSPYKACNIIEFWRRWHITLSRFLRDYLYVPLGGNRRGPARRYVNLMATMLLGGLWHGAGWTFVIWGGLHGLYLAVNHLWHALRKVAGFPAGVPSVLGRIAGSVVTLLAVVVAWVFFRARDLHAAVSMLRGMAGSNGALLPQQLVDLVPPLGRVAGSAGAVPFLAGGSVLGFIVMEALIGIGLSIALFLPHLHQISPRTRLYLLVPCFGFTLQRLVACDASPFLYFRF